MWRYLDNLKSTEQTRDAHRNRHVSESVDVGDVLDSLQRHLTSYHHNLTF